jgi:hypothetical protein
MIMRIINWIFYESNSCTSPSSIGKPDKTLFEYDLSTFFNHFFVHLKL